MDYDIVSTSPAETIEFGAALGSCLRGGEVIAVCGVLGSGKTHLIKGVARGAGAAACEQVSSPTFVIVNEYTTASGLDVYHIDAYRLHSITEFEMVGFDDLCYPRSVVLIEWADKIEEALKGTDYIRIELVHSGKSTRHIQIQNVPPYIML
jgi:tRNA threonylcarbamoyladenosine biosynthesis protein TsaE